MQCAMQVLNSKSSSSFVHTFLQWLIEQGAAGINISMHVSLIIVLVAIFVIPADVKNDLDVLASYGSLHQYWLQLL